MIEQMIEVINHYIDNEETAEWIAEDLLNHFIILEKE